MEFRLLRADEIEARISTCNQYGVGILLYKDARVDMNILDETVGAMNWQRDHKELKGNIYCGVSLWDNEKQQWVTKWDCGKESYTESEKGESSDSFKRACFNIGIGRELYTAPQMFVRAKDLKTLKEYNGRWTCNDYFTVEEIEYIGKRICYVKIKNEKAGVSIEFGTPAKAEKEQQRIARDTIPQVKAESLLSRCKNDGITPEFVSSLYKVNTIFHLTEKQFQNIHENWSKIIEKYKEQ